MLPGLRDLLGVKGDQMDTYHSLFCLFCDMLWLSLGVCGLVMQQFHCTKGQFLREDDALDPLR